MPALASFTIISDDFLKYKTFITQQMLNKNYLNKLIFYMHQFLMIKRY